MAWFRKSYECDRCGETWRDEWSCLCNDRCPTCNLETEPSDHEDLSVLVQASRFVADAPGHAIIAECEDAEVEKFAVLKSSDGAEDEPDYRVVNVFDTRPEAEAFAKTLQA